MKTFTFYYCSTCHVLAGGLLPKNLASTSQSSWHIMRKGGDAMQCRLSKASTLWITNFNGTS